MQRALLGFLITAVLAVGSAAGGDQTAHVTIQVETGPWPGVHAEPGDSSFGNAPSADGVRIDAVTYISGSRMKFVSPVSTMLSTVDGRMKLVYPLTKTWCVQSTPPGSTMTQFNQLPVTAVTNMHQTKTIIGYETHLYKIEEKRAGVTAVCNIWLAPSIPSPYTLTFTSANPILASVLKRELAGTPLQASFVSMNSRRGVKMSMDYAVNSLSLAPIPPSIFAIPADYVNTSPGAVLNGGKANVQKYIRSGDASVFNRIEHSTTDYSIAVVR